MYGFQHFHQIQRPALLPPDFIGNSFRICNWTLIVLSLIWFIYGFLSWILYCGTRVQADFEGGWSACDPWGFDIQMSVFVLDSFIDLFILVLPIPFVSIDLAESLDIVGSS